MKYVIIGNGVAGVDTAMTIQKNDPEGEITIISESLNLLYFRPKLVEYLGEDMPKEKLSIFKQEIYDKKGIKHILGQRIVKIDSSQKLLTSKTGDTFHYDKLCIATGARPFIPPIDNSSIAGVFALRTFKHADAIRDHVKRGAKKHLVVAGGGLLGLETAFHLGTHFEKISVVELGDYLLPRQLGKEGGEFLTKRLQEKGIDFHFGTLVERVNGDESVESVTLKNGETIPCDCFIVSAGVRPRHELACESGLATDKGIVVDKMMQTSSDDIYAAGDCIEYDGKLFGLWISSKEQARVAGNAMTGVADEFSGLIPSVVLKITGIDLFSAGEVHRDDVLIERDISEHTYKKVFYQGDEPVGVEIIGDKQAIMAARKMMAGKYPVAEFIEEMM